MEPDQNNNFLSSNEGLSKLSEPHLQRRAELKIIVVNKHYHLEELLVSLSQICSAMTLTSR